MMSLLSRFIVLSAHLLLTVYSFVTPDKLSTSTNFTLQQVKNPSFVANGTQQIKATYAKYHSSNSDNGPPTNGSDSTPTEVANEPILADSEYLVNISVSGQELTVNFDTGSADLWVFSTRLPEDKRAKHTAFDPRPPFHILPDYDWTISYGDLSNASGIVGIGEVDIGGAIVSNQAVELADYVSNGLVKDTAIDGIVGFAWSDINTVEPEKQNTWFDNIKDSLPLPVFTADLRHHEPGTYDFGFIDQSKFVGTVNYQTVNTTNGYWEFKADAFAVGNGILGDGMMMTPEEGMYPVIVDTGTSLLMMQEDIVRAYYDQIPLAGYDEFQDGFTFPCMDPMFLPDLTIQFGDYSAVISSQYMIYVQISEIACFGSLQISGVDINVLGDIFMKSQFVVFDGDITHPRVGLAAKS